MSSPLRHLYMNIFYSSIAAEKNIRQHNNKHQTVKLLEQHTRPLIKANWVVFGACAHHHTEHITNSAHRRILSSANRRNLAHD